MIQTVPVLTKTIGALLLGGYMMVSSLINLTSPIPNQIISWDGENQYQCSINGEQATIYLDQSPHIKKQINKNKQTNIDGDVDTSTEEETITEYESPSNKIKIIFKDDKTKGTTIIYERDLNGEIGDKDQQYIERILHDIEYFHKENRTYNKIKNKLDNFWDGLRRK